MRILLLLSFVAVLAGCKNISYSFTGANYDAETISVSFFENRAPLASPTLSQTFTEALRDIFTNQTSLQLVDKYGELQFEGEITNYVTRPVAPTGNETAALNRLAITVNVRYTDTKNEEKSFEKSFTRFADFDNTQTLSAVEDDLIEDINQQLAQEIFNQSVGQW